MPRMNLDEEEAVVIARRREASQIYRNGRRSGITDAFQCLNGVLDGNRTMHEAYEQVKALLDEAS